MLVGIETLLFLLMSNYKDIYFPPFQKDSSFVKTRDISYNSNLLLFMVLEEDKLAHNYPDDGAPKHLFSRWFYPTNTLFLPLYAKSSSQ